jgi:hypothetical protein
MGPVASGLRELETQAESVVLNDAAATLDKVKRHIEQARSFIADYLGASAPAESVKFAEL